MMSTWLLASICFTQADLAGLTEQRMAALLVGRWPSGAPLMRTPTGDDARLADGISANAFRFDGAEPVHAFVGGNETRSHRRPGMTRACAARSGRTYARSIPETSRRRRVRAPPCSHAGCCGAGFPSAPRSTPRGRWPP
jgi:hypothetical protein